jgi:hypothetical protein
MNAVATGARMPIPRRIIQTGKSAALSLKERASACNLKLLNPDYEYLFFDDQQVEDFIDRHFRQYRRIVDRFPYRIQRYDFFRYLAVHHYGGFYFDLDVFLAQPLDTLLSSGCIFSFEGLTFSRFLRQRGLDWQIGNYAFGSAPGHPFLRSVIENCVRSMEDPAWVGPMMKGAPPMSRSEFFILNTTGPGLLSRTLCENASLADQMTVLFPKDVCDVANWNRFGDYGVHHMDGSWRTKQGFLRHRIAQYWEVWKMRKLHEESRRQGPTRSLQFRTADV